MQFQGKILIGASGGNTSQTVTLFCLFALLESVGICTSVEWPCIEFVHFGLLRDINTPATSGRFYISIGRLRLKCDGTCSETRFRLPAKRTSPFKSAGGRQFSRLLAAEVCAISGSNGGYSVFRGSVKGAGYPLHSPVSPLFPLPCVTVCHHISTGVC